MSGIERLIIVRGGGDIATGTIYRLYQCGFTVLVLETANPSAIRRNVAFSEAVYQGKQTVESVICYLAESLEEAFDMLSKGRLVMLVDPEGECISSLQPMAVVDGILAKKNLGTNRKMADITVALGPGFEAGKDVDAVIETMRGHSLGRVIYQGRAMTNTGVPGVIGGYSKERVIHSPATGTLRNIKNITDTVRQGEVIAVIETMGNRNGADSPVEDELQIEKGQIPVVATIDGLLRGLIRDGYPVSKGFKIADIDPRMDQYENCFTISDKARCIAGGVLEAILHLKYIKEKL